MHPVLIDLGFFQLPTYGVMLVLAVGLGLWTLRLRARKAGLDGDRMVDLGLWIVIWGLLGSKATLILVELPRYVHHPAELVGVLRAGGVFLGGLLAALAAAVVLMRRYGLGFLETADAAAPSVALAHAIGRIGCLMAGCCWGSRCDLPWAITYTDPRAHANVGTPLGVPLHPFPAYSMLFNLALFVLLAWLYRRRPAAGRVFATYLILYGTGRFLLEYTRGDAIRGFIVPGLLSTSQGISIALVAAGLGLHWWVATRQKEG
jgi:phosphatidylglycerol:prolipoprotein diacylglycerol transferase